jgi:hypothetical protein
MTPASTRSGPPHQAMTIGTSFVACMVARIAPGAMATVSSTLAATISLAIGAVRSRWPSALRVSKLMLRPSILLRATEPTDAAHALGRLRPGDTRSRQRSRRQRDAACEDRTSAHAKPPVLPWYPEWRVHGTVLVRRLDARVCAAAGIQVRNASLAACAVAAMSSALCAALTKPASYSAGARYTARSSMPWKKRLKRSLSVAMTAP